MNCISEIDIVFWLYQGLYELERNLILQLQSLFRILETSTYTRMGAGFSAYSLSYETK